MRRESVSRWREREERESGNAACQSFPPTACVCNLSGKGYIRERVVVLWEVLTASSLLPPTAEEVLMEEDFKEMGGGKSSTDV